MACGRGNVGQTNYGMSNSIMERICEKRKSDGYPGLAIQWGAIGEVGLLTKMQGLTANSEVRGTLPQRMSSCLGALEKFLTQDEPVVASMVVAEENEGGKKSENIVNTVMRIMGIADLKAVGMHRSFSQLGIDSIMTVEMKQTLEREFNCNISTKDLRRMTFARLQEMEHEWLGVEQPSSEISRRIAELYFYMPNIADNLAEYSQIIRLKTLVSETDIAPLAILLPGINGTGTLLEPLAAFLRCHAYCPQYDDSTSSIEELSQQILFQCLSLLPKQAPFTVVAHSFGCVVALHLVSLLESKGYEGQLVLIDGSPSVFKKQLSAKIPNVEDERFLQSYVLTGLAKFWIPEDSRMGVAETLLDCANLEERVGRLLKFAPNEAVAAKDRYRKILASTYGRIKSCLHFETSFKIRSSVTLCKPTQSVSREDYELGKLCEGPILTKTFDGTHFTVLKNREMIETINELINRT